MTTRQFLAAFGLETLRDLPDVEALEDEGVLRRRGMAAEFVSSEGADLEN